MSSDITNNSNVAKGGYERDAKVSEMQAQKLGEQYLFGEKLNGILKINKMRLITKHDVMYEAFSDELQLNYVYIIPTTLKVRIFQGLKWGILYVNKFTGAVVYGGEGPA